MEDFFARIEFKKILLLFFCAVLVVSMLAACENKTEASSWETFTVVEETPDWKIVVDKKTFVMYAVSSGAYNRGTFTLLIDENGHPKIYTND